MDAREHINIRPHHRTRLAVVYVRTAQTPDTLEDYTCLKAQRDQVQHALAWGWSQNAIHVIEDLGVSGSSAEKRLGWQRLLDLVRQAQVGMLLVSDLTRLSRTAADLQVILGLCQQTQTLVVVDGKICRDEPADALLQSLRDNIAEHERAMQAERFSSNAGTRPQAGTAPADKYQVAMQPDRFAREVMTGLASYFERFGTIEAVRQNARTLAKDWPCPATRLLQEVIALLRDFEEVCQRWRAEYEPTDF